MTLQALEDIYLMSTTTAGEKPAAGQLQLGEVAFNVTDKLMFVGTGSGGFIEVDLTARGGAGVAVPPPDEVTIVTGTAGKLQVDVLDQGLF
jgi:hypothetical protein